MKILSRSFYAEILALQGFPAGLRASYFIRDKSGYSEIQDNQSFSIAGSRKGFGDPRGTLFFELARLAEARKPSYLLFENVPYVQKCIRYIMYTNQICIVPPKNSGERLFVLCSTVHNMFLLAKGMPSWYRCIARVCRSIWGCTRAGMDVQACRADSPYFFTNAVTVSGDIGL